MVGICYICIFGLFEVSRLIPGHTWSLRETIGYRLTHSIPHHAQPVNVGGRFPARANRYPVRERIILAHIVAGTSHRTDDIIGHPVPADIPPGACQPAGYYAMTAIKQPWKEIRSISYAQQGWTGVCRIAGKAPGRNGNQRGG